MNRCTEKNQLIKIKKENYFWFNKIKKGNKFPLKKFTTDKFFI
jgi:SET domain-containing protein